MSTEPELFEHGPIAVDEFIQSGGFPLCEMCAGEFDSADLRNGICDDCEEQLGFDQ